MISKVFFIAALACASQAAVSRVVPVVAKISDDTVDLSPQYSYAYDVQDALTGDSKAHLESRNGDIVKGQYSLNDPDGTRRIVDYTADPVNGFRAVVRKEPSTAIAEPVAAEPVEVEPVIAKTVAAPLVARAITAPLLTRAAAIRATKFPADSEAVESVEVAPKSVPVTALPAFGVSAPLISSPYVAAPVLSYSRLQNNIIVLTLPPHSIHRLQPLNRAIYSPLKNQYAIEAYKWMAQHAGRSLTFDIAFRKDATVGNAASAFRVTGIYPYDDTLFTEAGFAPSSVTDMFCPSEAVTQNSSTSNSVTTVEIQERQSHRALAIGSLHKNQVLLRLPIWQKRKRF
uniref:Cuticular protein 70 n=1 Tax=Leptinotarsa decemlineata TaxID=7539 RepID=A0A3Q8HFT5_LEPDE|nr:cuticular protein 70 [Leptinotarsa decemlineata]